MHCNLCQSSNFSLRNGTVRAAPHLQALEYADWGLVTLSSHEQIRQGFCGHVDMHGDEPQTLIAWLPDTEGDEQQHYEMLKSRDLLDVGCDAAGFLDRACALAAFVAGVEPEQRVRECRQDRLTIHADMTAAASAAPLDGYDLIAAFHVNEHQSDLRAVLAELARMLAANDHLVIEVPSSQDALLTLYDSTAFQDFTYWSQHLYLFSAETLRNLAEQAGLQVVAIQQVRRYPLANHLYLYWYWLSQSKPSGHRFGGCLAVPEMRSANASALAGLGICDALTTHLKPVARQ